MIQTNKGKVQVFIGALKLKNFQIRQEILKRQSVRTMIHFSVLRTHNQSFRALRTENLSPSINLRDLKALLENLTRP